ncbi:hypothetical protein HDU83_009449 [Entophlyctis luteolus]|nr:hypothetical protein HDU83_009449 [Entophlyctis luteolus]
MEDLDGDVLLRDTVASFRPAKVFNYDKPFTCIDFDSAGVLCLATCEDELRMYDCLNASYKKASFSKKYGCGIAKFTHRQYNVLYSSTKEDDAIRYLSFHDNKFIRYFSGHESRVNGIEMCPQDDQFLSSSRDGEVRLWDLKANNCVGVLKTNTTNPRIAFDPTGAIFAVTTNSSSIRLYDLKSLSAGPFATFKIPNDFGSGSSSHGGEWTAIKFSNDGKWLLLSNKVGTCCAIDAFEGKVLATYTGRRTNGYKGPLDMEATITPDGRFILGGADDGSVHVWEAPVIRDGASGQREVVRSFTQLPGSKDPLPLIKFNPRFMMFASASESSLERDQVIDYNAVDKRGTAVWTKVGLDMCADMLREADKRNPAVCGLSTTVSIDYLAEGELEVIENHLRVVLKSLKAASKKKAPQSAWKPVYASMEALTIFFQTKTAWLKSKDANRAAAIFCAFGAGWITVAERLTELGSFGENAYPSVRCAVNATLAFGNEVNEASGKKISDWPAKFESVWTGNEYAGDKKKKPQAVNNDDAKKKASKKKKNDEFGSDDEDDGGKKKKGAKKATAAPAAAAVVMNPWDFEECIARLKGERKQIGGSEFDIDSMSEEMKLKLVVAN